jgi:hypothetical protein
MRAVFFVLAVAAIVQAQKPDLIQSASPFSAGGAIVLKPDPQCVALRKLPAPAQSSSRVKEAIQDCARQGPKKIESGTINGVTYLFYYSDGSGEFASAPNVSLNVYDPNNGWERAWQVGCEKDPITDKKSCHADRGDFRVWVDSAGRSEIYIGSSHYPGTQVVIRIDKTAPLAVNSRAFNGSFGYRTSPNIIKRIASAKTVTTRFQKWPDRDYVDETWNTFGFNETLAYIRWAVARIR